MAFILNFSDGLGQIDPTQWFLLKRHSDEMISVTTILWPKPNFKILNIICFL